MLVREPTSFGRENVIAFVIPSFGENVVVVGTSYKVLEV